MAASPAEPTSPPASSPSDDAPIIGKFDADRLCPRCLHQQHGAIVYRDPRLGILYIRCTECGTSSAVTEYPVAWRWLRRFGILIAGILALVALALLAGDVAATCASTYEFTWEATRDFADAIQAEGQRRDASATWQMTPEFRRDTEAIQEAVSDPVVIRNAEWRFRYGLIPLSMVQMGFGMAWACLLLHRRVWLSLFFQLLPLVLAIAFFALVMFLDRPVGTSSWSYRQYAAMTFGPEIALYYMAWNTAVRMTAVLLARPFLRLFLWMVVPKRIHRAVKSVWTDDAIPG